MLQHIKLREHRALKGQEVILNNLGHINVICGKNNGGKSSILEAINFLNKDTSIAIAGKKIEKEYFIKVMFPPKSAPFSLDGDAALFEDCTKSFFDTINGNIYFANENEKLFGEIYQWGKKNRLRTALNLSPDALNFFNFFKEENAIKTEIIFPKRKFDFKVNLMSIYNPENDSKYTNMIKKLHAIKNAANQGDEANFEKIKSNFKKITSCDFDVVQSDTKVGDTERIELRFKLQDVWFNVESCGIGFSDILYIVFFIFVTANDLVLIEEPENHLHPELQKKLLYFLVEQKDKQFIITTHSNVFLDTVLVDKILYTEILKGRIQVSDKTSKSEILQKLGYSVSDNLVSDLIIFVEGPTDIPVVRTILSWMNIDQRYNIRYLPLCGDFMNHVDLEAFAEKSNVMALVDREPKQGSEKQRKIFLEECKRIGIKAHRLKRYAIENYFTLEALKSVFKGQIKSELTSIDESTSLEEQLGLNVKNNNQKIISLMKESDIDGTDLYGFCKDILNFMEKQS